MIPLLGALILGGIGFYVSNTDISHAKSMPVVPALGAVVENPTANQLPASGSFSPVVKSTAPAVVSITASRTVKAGNMPMNFPFFFGPGWDPFGGRGQQEPEQRERREQGLGSGVIVTAEGYILTNHHVIDGASEVKVHLSDKRELTARIAGSDAKTDIAVLKVDALDLPVLPLGNSTNVEVGDIVLAIGNPFGIGQTVTMGIVGATGRRGLSIEDYEDFIQTDAAINPGNSGGALINSRGELIGINTAILSRSGGNQGVGFAVPVNLAHHVMTQILTNGKVVRGYLGVMIQPVTPAIAKSFGVEESRGALVGDVTAGGPASKAGIKKGDVVVDVNGKPVDDPDQLKLQIASIAPGTEVDLKIKRDGGERNIVATLGELPGEPGESVTPTKGSSPMSGLSVDDLSPAVAQQLDLPPGTTGVVIVNVDPGSAAAEAGLRRGDVISEVARKPVSSVAEFNQAVGAAGSDDVLLLVNRGGNSMFVVVESR